MSYTREQAAKAVEVVELFYREARAEGVIPDIVDTAGRGTAVLDQQLEAAAGLSLGKLVNANFAVGRLHKDPKRDGPFGLADSMLPAMRYDINLKALRDAAKPKI